MLDIAEVAEISGTPPSALRYYEKVGLISPLFRKGLRRQYTEDVLYRLSLISMGKAAGFTLEEISAMFGMGPSISLPRNTILQKASALEAEISRLEKLARLMRHVANCGEENHFDCPRFQTLIKAANRSQRKTRAK